MPTLTAPPDARLLQARLVRTLEATSDFVGVARQDGQIEYLNPAGRALLGLEADADLFALRAVDLHPPETLARLAREAFPAALADGVWEGEGELLGAGGERIPVSIVLVGHEPDAPGEPPAFSALMRDLRERERAEAARRAQDRRLREVLAAAQLTVWERPLDAPRVVFHAATTAEAAAAARAAGEAARTFLETVHPDDQERVRAASRQARETHGALDVEFRHRAPDGGWRWRQTKGHVFPPDEHGPASMVGVDLDVTERKALEERLAQLAYHDPLTGLANRAHLRGRLRALLGGDPLGGGASGPASAVLLVDLDGFKAVNDTLGHGAGDRLLVEVAARLRAATRGCDTVARLGGDEFAVLLAGVPDERAALVVAERVLAALRAPVRIDGAEARVGGSVGVALADAERGGAPDDAALDALLRDADVALYAAKAAGKGRAVVYARPTAASDAGR